MDKACRTRLALIVWPPLLPLLATFLRHRSATAKARQFYALGPCGKMPPSASLPHGRSFGGYDQSPSLAQAAAVPSRLCLD
eukprot:7261965-Prymnesium_polylepis.1